MSVLSTTWQLTFQKSPIILTNGVATNIPYGMLPIIAITESLNFVDGLLSGANISLDNFFADWLPLPGATLIDQQIGEYPFANQAVAANAVIAQPLVISMLMICPVRQNFGYPLKLATLSALKATLDLHNQSGGTYTVATPSYFYTDCVMTSMRDVTAGDSKQLQTTWQLDFRKPLLTLQQAEEAQSSLLSKITSGVPIDGQPAWSGLSTAVGSVSPTSTSLLPSAASTGAAGVAGATSFLGGG